MLNSCRIWSTTQLNTPHPHPHTVSIYCTFTLGRREGQREGRGATVHKRGRKYQYDWLNLQSIKFIKQQVKTTFRVWCHCSSFVHAISSLSFPYLSLWMKFALMSSPSSLCRRVLPPSEWDRWSMYYTPPPRPPPPSLLSTPPSAPSL